MVHFGDLLQNAESLVAKIQSADGVPPVQRGLTEIARESTMLGADGGAQTVTPARGGAAARLLAEARIDAQSVRDEVHRLEQLAQHDAVALPRRAPAARTRRATSTATSRITCARARARRARVLGLARSRTALLSLSLSLSHASSALSSSSQHDTSDARGDRGRARRRARAPRPTTRRTARSSRAWAGERARLMQRLGWRGLPAATPAPAAPPAPPMAALEGVEATRAGAVNALRDALGAAGGDLLAAFSARSGNFSGSRHCTCPRPRRARPRASRPPPCSRRARPVQPRPSTSARRRTRESCGA